jgi:gp6-like head-tail connector protein
VEYFVVGQVVRLMHTVLNDTGSPANAATVTLTITLPDATTVTPTPTNTGTGTYRYDYTTTQAGRHTYRWDTTGPIAPDDGVFDVQGSPLGIISLEDAKTQLNITTSTHDEELRRIIESATEVIERHTQTAVVRRTRVDYPVTHCARRIHLTWAPVILLVSVRTIDGLTSWNVADLHVVPDTGRVSILAGGYFTGDLEMIYVAGRTVISANHLKSAELIVQHLWETKRGTRGGPRPGGMDDTVTVPGMGFAVPRAALELLGKSPTMVR